MQIFLTGIFNISTSCPDHPPSPHQLQELGRLDAPGRPLLFGTTEEFLRSFGVSSIDELPVLSPVQVEEFKQEAEEEMHVKLDV